jgi:uroporphyrinogen decarboxylase
MTEIENFYKVVKFEKPEFIPSRIPDHLASYLGSNHESFKGQGHHSPVGTVWEDVWGITWKKEMDGVMGFPVIHPLADLTELDEFAFPDLDDPQLTERIYDEAQKADDRILSGANNNLVWEKACYLVGMENLMVYLYTEPELVKKLFHRIMDFQLNLAEHNVKAGCRIIYMGDDHGAQNSLLLGMELFNKFILPEYERIFDYYRDKDIVINFHSCGHIEPLLDTLINLGVHILNPVQANANDLEKVRKLTKGKLVLQGAVDSAVVYGGTEDEIRGLVRRRIDSLGTDGGYICCPDQGLKYPPHNYEILEDEVAKYKPKD